MWVGVCVAHSPRVGRAGRGCVLLSACTLLVLQDAGGGVYMVGGSAVLRGSQISSCTASASNRVCCSRGSGVCEVVVVCGRV